VQFISVRDLRLKSGEIWRQLKEEGEMVVTSNGRPVAVLSSADEHDLGEYITALRRVRVVLAVNKMQEHALQKCLDNALLRRLN